MQDDPQPLIQILRRPPEVSAAPDHVAPFAAEWPAVAERLRRSAEARTPQAASERCEVCGAEIGAGHGHLVNVPTRTLLCVCRPCYLVFTHDGAGRARFRAVPQRYRSLPGFEAARDRWEALQLPTGLAFFFRNSATGQATAFYPSPAGATESELPLDAWDALTSAVPLLFTLAPDVEALLVRTGPPSPLRGFGGARAMEALIVPVDACYELVGRIRRAWRGFQGGDEVWAEIDNFFIRARERAGGAAAV
jgi:hypothetical protein